MRTQKKKDFRGDAGFSLVGLLVALSLFTLTMTAFADMMVISAKSQRDMRSNSEINTMFERVRKVVDPEWSCTASLRGQEPSGPLIVRDPVAPARIIAREGASDGASKAWLIQQIRFENLEALADQPGVMRGTLILRAAKEKKLQVGSHLVKRALADVYFDVDGAGRIVSCRKINDDGKKN